MWASEANKSNLKRRKKARLFAPDAVWASEGASNKAVSGGKAKAASKKADALWASEGVTKNYNLKRKEIARLLVGNLKRK